MKKILVANWKMNPLGEDEALRLAKASDEKGVVVCPPDIFLKPIHNVLRKADLGSQNVFWENSPTGGAFTGEISLSMLKKQGVSHTIIGHSERRKHLGETDEMINKKVLAALANGFKVILCVGESGVVRREGIDQAKSFIKSQLIADLKDLSKIKSRVGNLIIAYEPIWAISAGLGTGHADNPEDVLEMIKFIHSVLSSKFSVLNSKVLYGGSVTFSNASRILRWPEIDGALVGGASLKALEFKKIINVVSKL